MHLSDYRVTRLAIAVLCAVSFVGLPFAAEYPAPVQKAIERCAKTCRVDVAAVTVVSSDLVEWPDASLGAPQPGEVYAQVITHGYKVILQAEGRRYEYHTDMRERVVLAASGNGVAGPPTAKGAATTSEQSAAGRCRADLAGRLKVKLEQIKVVKEEPRTFLDGSLGFPRPGEVYTKAITRGVLLTLARGEREYLYAANDTVIRYGGPADARANSALYIEPIPDEPNMNGDLVQVALAGDNPRVLLSGVDNFRPQADGSIMAMRRTSRSGHDLLYLAPGKMGEAVRVASGLDFTDAAVSTDGQRWAAICRPRVGAGGWFLIGGPVAKAPEGEPIVLPPGIPQRVYLHLANPVVRVMKDDQPEYYEWVQGAFRPVRFEAPPSEETLMSRSTSLLVETKEVEGKPVTEIMTLWWHGLREPIAQIPGFVVEEYARALGGPFLLLSGRSGDKHRGYTVDILTGEVLETVTEAHGPVRLLPAPSARPIVMPGPSD